MPNRPKRTNSSNAIKILACGLIALGSLSFRSASFAQQSGGVPPTPVEQPVTFRGDGKFCDIVNKAKENNWRALPIGELMGKIADMLEGTPYVASTLELSPDVELCSANLDELDCVTFFETTLGLARMIKKGGETHKDLLAEIQLTRYRGGSVGDYASRLHYTSDWLADNENKQTVKVLSKLPGAEKFPKKVNFMSSHPASYKQLAAHPELVEKIKQRENEINARTLIYVPLDKVADAEPLLQTGDIVGICTNVPGLDISHTGLVIRDKDGVPHFMDASSQKKNMKVTLEPGPISQYMTQSNERSQKIIGVVFARPLEPKAHPSTDIAN
ncbi:MAG TPA: DUF1460 domain-containing protein [Candidatus Melainabacteria bacterium]|nr:DUF1460 domain-containing protein [Candidatus Melainabacteria bacterium]HIN66096.1 DUF1460 domain-containing protein [Candidatus Obscuribacterales bacterium]